MALSCLPARAPDCQRNRCDHVRGTVSSQLSIVADVPLAHVVQPRSWPRTDRWRSPVPSKKSCRRGQSKNSSYNITFQIANRFHYWRSGAIFAFVLDVNVDWQSSAFIPTMLPKSGRFLLARARQPSKSETAKRGRSPGISRWDNLSFEREARADNHILS